MPEDVVQSILRYEKLVQCNFTMNRNTLHHTCHHFGSSLSHESRSQVYLSSRHHVPCGFPFAGGKLWRSLCPGPPPGCPLHPVLLHPTPEPGSGLWGEERGSVCNRGLQRHLQFGRVHLKRTDSYAAVAAVWVSNSAEDESLILFSC